jgi:glycosyltransferase involved in cell wall biosynthesis
MTPAGDEPLTFLIYSPFPKYSGGRENWLHNLAPHLRERGRQVRVVAYASNRAPFYSVEQSGIGVVALPSVRYFDRVFRFLNRATLGLLKYLDLFFFYPIVAALYLASTRPRNLVCMNSIPEGMVALLAGVPYVVSVRGDVPKGLSHPLTFLERPLRWLERQVLSRARKVLANGRDTQERLAGAAIASTVVPNGVDFKRFAEPAPSGELGRELERRAGGRPVIAFIATIDEMRGVTDAIDCSVELKALEPNFMLAMVGKGDAGPYKSRVQALGLAGWVEFMGQTASVVEVLQRSSIFLGLSRGNGISMSALEAMAAGVPMVARDVLTYRQLIEDGRSGLLASGASEFADCCVRLLRDPEAARTLGRTAQAAARDYDWPRIADIFLDQIESVLAGGLG